MILKVNGKTYSQILEHLDKAKKIAAIKALRNDAGCGLKEAKHAVERLQHERGDAKGLAPDFIETCPKIIVGPIIKKLTVDFGDGEIEVDLEKMQMMGLMQMQQIGLEACGEILDLVDTLTAFANGRKIGVIDESG